MQVRNLIVGLSVLATTALVANGAVLLYEPFNYGPTDASDATTLSGTATGLDGTAYTGHGGTATVYTAAGLTLGDLVTSGGYVRVPFQSSGTNGISRGLSFGFDAGSTLYGSMLFQQPEGDVSNSTNAVLFGSSGATDNTADLAVRPHIGGFPNIAGIRTAAGGANATGTEYGSLSTVLVLFQVTNMNAVSGTQDLSLWVLNAAQFANFKAGGLDAAELNAATTGATATDVLQRATYPNTGTYAALFDTDVMRLYNFRFNGAYDEIRVGSASLDEVTPLVVVPEPSSLVALGLLSTIPLRRHR